MKILNRFLNLFSTPTYGSTPISAPSVSESKAALFVLVPVCSPVLVLCFGNALASEGLTSFLGLPIFAAVIAISAISSLVATAGLMLVNKIRKSRYFNVGSLFRYHLGLIGARIEEAEAAIKAGDFPKDSEPYLLCKSTRDAFEQAILAATRVHAEMSKFRKTETPRRRLQDPASLKLLKDFSDLPRDVQVQAERLLESLSVFDSFESTFKESTALFLRQREAPLAPHPDLEDFLSASGALAERFSESALNAKFDRMARNELDALQEQSLPPLKKVTKVPELKSSPLRN